MRFSLKVQSIGSNTSEAKDYTAITHEFEVPDDIALQKRGRLFITINISAKDGFELKEATSLFVESLQESYYKLSDETPLHAIESSLKRANQLLLSVQSKNGDDVLGSAKSNLSVSYSTALIWNRVLYTSYIGSPAIYLIRGTGARDLATEKFPSDIWTNSNILENEDVIIIGTEAFAKAFPTNEIINSLGALSTAISTNPEVEKLSAILIKASASTEKQGPSITEKVRDLKIGNSISNTIWKVKNKVSENQALSNKFKFYQSKKAAPVSSISGAAEKQTQHLPETSKSSPKRISGKKVSQNGTKQIAVGFLMLAGVVFANYKLFYEDRLKQESNRYDQIVFNNTTTNGEVKGQSSTEIESAIHSEIITFSDISENLLPTGIGTIRNGLIVLNSPNRNLYKIDLSTKEVTVARSDINNPKLVKCEILISTDKDICFVYTREGFFVLAPLETEDKVDTYFADLEGVVDIYPYWDTLYILTTDNIYTYKLNGTEPKKWLTTDVLSETKSIAVDVDSYIYILSSNDIYRYANGKLATSFKVDKSKLSNPSQIQISKTSIYVLDRKKVILFKRSTGEYEREIVLTDKIDPEIPTSFTLSKDSSPKVIFEKGKSFFVVEE